MRVTIDKELCVLVEGHGYVGRLAVLRYKNRYGLVWTSDWERFKPLELDVLFLEIQPTLDLLNITHRLTG